MRIERISENQIKCTLNRADLASRQLKISELAYGTEKTRGLFQDMMDQAFLEVGFEASDLPLMIEAIPVSMDCIVLMITKVEDPDEMDQDFASLSNVNDWLPQSDESPFQSLFDMTLPGLQAGTAAIDQDFAGSGALVNVSDKGADKLERIYSFDDITSVISFAHSAGDNYKGKNSLYKSASDGRYYLIMVNSTGDVNEFGRICSVALEYGSKEPLGFARSAFIKEHFKMIIRDKAIQNLANV